MHERQCFPIPVSKQDSCKVGGERRALSGREMTGDVIALQGQRGNHFLLNYAAWAQILPPARQLLSLSAFSPPAEPHSRVRASRKRPEIAWCKHQPALRQYTQANSSLPPISFSPSLTSGYFCSHHTSRVLTGHIWGRGKHSLCWESNQPLSRGLRRYSSRLLLRNSRPSFRALYKPPKFRRLSLVCHCLSAWGYHGSLVWWSGAAKSLA